MHNSPLFDLNARKKIIRFRRMCILPMITTHKTLQRNYSIWYGKQATLHIYYISRIPHRESNSTIANNCINLISTLIVSKHIRYICVTWYKVSELNSIFFFSLEKCTLCYMWNTIRIFNEKYIGMEYVTIYTWWFLF